MPPGQAKKLYNVGQRFPRSYGNPLGYNQIPYDLRPQYGLDPHDNYYYGDGYLYQVDPQDDADPAGGQRAPALAPVNAIGKAVRTTGRPFLCPPRVLAARPSKELALGRVHASQEQQDHQGPRRISAEDGKRLKTLQNLPLRPRQRRQPALRPLHHRPRQMRADGPRRADQDQERDRPDADLPPLVPRGHLRVVLDEHGRPQRPRLHDRDRGPQGRGADHAAAAHGGGQGPRPRPHPRLRPICADPAVAEDRDARRRRASGCSRPTTAPSSTASTSASCASAARPAARAIGGTPTSSSARRSCSRPIAGSPTAATRRPASGSTSSRTRSASTAATRS